MNYTLPEHMLSTVSGYIADNLALHFPKDRWNDLERNISAAAKEAGYSDVESFIRRIVSAPMTHEYGELLTSHLTVNETYFWREPETFDALEHSVLPELIRSRQVEKRMRIWSAGCSTGEEPYSIAIVIHRVIPHPDDWNITILATDISPRIVRKAAVGVYDERSFRNSPAWLKERYFVSAEKNIFAIIPEIKRMVKFEYLNLADDVYPSMLNDTNAMDIIFCRNVLIYFTSKRCAQVVNGLSNSLIPGGYLVVSASELSLRALSELTATNFPGMVLYQKGSKQPGERQHSNAGVPASVVVGNSSPLNFNNIEKVSEPLHDQAKSVLPPQGAIPAKVLSIYEKAEASYVQGNYSDVIEKLQKYDQSPDERILQIRAYANLGMLDKALQSCEKAVAADKLNPGLHYLYATILLEHDRVEEAGASLKRAIYLDHNFVLAYFLLGKVYQRLGNGKSAKKCDENVLTILKTCSQDEILFESEGLTAGRFKEMMYAAMKTRDRV